MEPENSYENFNVATNSETRVGDTAKMVIKEMRVTAKIFILLAIAFG